MRLVLVFGIVIAVILLYFLARGFFRRSSIVSAQRQDIEELLTSEKYQVRGRFD